MFTVLIVAPIRSVVQLLVEWSPSSWVRMLINTNGLSAMGYVVSVGIVAIYCGFIVLFWWGLSKVLNLPIYQDSQRSLPRHSD